MADQAVAQRRRRKDVIANCKTFVTRVARTRLLTPRMARITLAGGDLGRFVSAGPDQFVYVLLPPVGRTQLTIDSSFTWDAYRAMPEAERPVGAYYTVRRHRPEFGELDLDFVLHGDEGVGSAWAARAKPGDEVAVWGPRIAFEPPADTTWRLLVADETGLPALGSICESLPAGAKVHAIVEVTDEYDELPFDCAADVHVHWIHRGSAPVGTTDLLIDAVRELALPAGEQVYAWGGGEIRAMNDVRHHLRKERGLTKDQVSVLAYWRHTSHADDDRDVSEA